MGRQQEQLIAAGASGFDGRGIGYISGHQGNIDPERLTRPVLITDDAAEFHALPDQFLDNVFSGRPGCAD